VCGGEEARGGAGAVGHADVEEGEAVRFGICVMIWEGVWGWDLYINCNMGMMILMVHDERNFRLMHCS
jgi:hypothetical protein